MKAVFNDATNLQIQSAAASGDYLHIKTISATSEELWAKFSDAFACQQIDIVERGQTIATHKAYTEMYRIEEYTGGILGVVMYRPGKSPEERIDEVDGRVTSVEETLDIIVKGEGTNVNNTGTGEAV